MDNRFMDYLSARVDATASDLKTSLHEQVDSTVDSRRDTFKCELNSIFRSGVIERIRTQGGNQHWLVETTYTCVSPYQQNLPLELPSIASHSTGFIQGIPPPLLTDHEEGTASAGMSKVDQCIADVTFPSGHSVSIPLFDTVRNDSEDISEQSQQTQDQLPSSSSGESRTDFSLGPNLNNTEQNTLQTQNTQNSQSQVIEPNVEHPLNGDIPSDDIDGENGQGPIDETNTEVNINQLMTPSTSGYINTGARSTNQIAPRKSAFHTVQPSVDDDDDEDYGSEDEGHYSQNRELTITQSKRKSVSSCDQSNKKAKHVDQIIDNDNDEDGKSTKTIYLNCTESDCGDHLNSMDDLHQHLTTKHGLLPYQCYSRECNFRCKYPSRLCLHLRVHHTDSTDFVCPVCAIQLASQVDVSKHRYNHYTGKFQCNIVDECKQVGATRREISFHLQRCNYHRPSTRLQCDQCSFSFPNKTKLNSHYKVHTRFNSFRCTWPDCLYQTNWHSAIIRHIRVKHFHLPVTKKEQLAENIMDDRDPADYFEEEITEQGGL